MTSETTLTLINLRFDDTAGEVVIQTELDLSKGRILGGVKKLARASQYEVKTAKGKIDIRDSYNAQEQPRK